MYTPGESCPGLPHFFRRASHDPYFLYAASNAGCLLALIAYPFIIEPRIGVAAQTRLWSAGYVGLAALILSTAGLLASPSGRGRRVLNAPSEGLILRQRLFWIAAAFLPSALMLAVTNHITANVGSVPFLWIFPLALYLLTFILAFARRLHATSTRISRLIPVVLLAVFPLVAAGVVAPPGLNWMVIGLHLLLLYCAALLCHTRLAESRPEPQHLTEFYFWIALGGVLGGIFTATLAPVLFRTVLEYPLLVATLPFFRIGKLEKSNWMVPALLGLAILVMWTLFRFTHLDSQTEAVALAHTTIVFIGYKLKNQTRRFAWSFAVV